MSRLALDFLTESVLWSDADQSEQYSVLDDDQLRHELARYREHVLEQPIRMTQGLAATLSARDQGWGEGTVARSALYFDEVLLPDPVFELTEWTRDGVFAFETELPRADLVQAVRRMRALVPLVRLGRVRFIPSTLALEAPERQLLLYSEDNFEGEVPLELREWFRDRAQIRKVVTDGHGRRLVLVAPPDLDTSSIQVSFGQHGRVHTYDHMRFLEFNEEDRSFTSAQMPPTDEESLQAWVAQSLNRSAGGLLKDTITDAAIAWRMDSSFVTSCAVTAKLLEGLPFEGISPPSPGLALELELPMVENASVEQIAELIEREPEAFEAFRFELNAVVESIHAAEGHSERAAQARDAVNKLTREQVHAVDRKVREARAALKWDIPMTAVQLGAGLLGLCAGDPSLGVLTAGLLTGGLTATGTLRKHQEHHALPGYFLWKLARA